MSDDGFTLRPQDQAANDQSNVVRLPLKQGEIVFRIGDEELIRFVPNGDIYVHGRLIDHDMDLVDGFRSWLKRCGVYR